MHNPPSNKPTRNQLVVSDALDIASRLGFQVGLNHLTANISGLNNDLEAWFSEKCKEHNIPSPMYPLHIADL